MRCTLNRPGELVHVRAPALARLHYHGLPEFTLTAIAYPKQQGVRVERQMLDATASKF